MVKTLSEPGGGAERIVSTLASSLAARGHEVSVLTFDRTESEDFYPVSPGVRRIRLGIGAADRRTGPGTMLFRAVRLRKTARMLRPDVVAAFMDSAFIPAAFALAGTGIPVVACERTSFSHYRRSLPERALFRALAPLCSGFTINSQSARSSFPPAIARRMIVIPNPVAAAPARADPVGGPHKLLLSVGSLNPHKNHAVLIRAFARAARKFPDWNLAIVGEGPSRSALEDLVGQLGLRGRVSLPGATQDVASYYRRAQLFALPSTYEGFPNALTEGLAHGLPAIGFADCPGTSELIVPGQNGILISGSDPIAALAAGLETLMSSVQMRRDLGKAAPKSVAYFLLDSIVEQWEEVFRHHRAGA